MCTDSVQSVYRPVPKCVQNVYTTPKNEQTQGLSETPTLRGAKALILTQRPSFLYALLISLTVNLFTSSVFKMVSVNFCVS